MEEVTAYENVNGFKLNLKVDESGSPKSINFTVTYKNNRVKVTWPKLSMIFTSLLYAGSFAYSHMNWVTLVFSTTVLGILIFFYCCSIVKSESLTVIPTVGLQSTVQYLITRQEKFVPWSQIDDVIINEVVKMNCVLYYLSVLMKCDNDEAALALLPLFKYTKPRLHLIEKIYSEIHKVLMKHVETEKQTNNTPTPKVFPSNRSLLKKKKIGKCSPRGLQYYDQETSTTQHMCGDVE